MDLISLVITLQLLTPPDPSTVPRWDDSGIASVYHNERDRAGLRGGTLACLWGRKQNDLPDDYKFCAHRSYACGTVLQVYLPKTGKSTYCVVVDRGPFGALLPNGKWVIKIRKSSPGKWRGILDMSPGTAKAVGSSGWDQVKIRRVRHVR